MTHEIRNRIQREATPDEKDRHREVRAQAEAELPELKQWARRAAAQHRERVAIGTVFTDVESGVVDAIDDYAERHSLANRAAVVREALSRLLGIEIARQ